MDRDFDDVHDEYTDEQIDEEEKSFAELLEESLVSRERLEPGQRVKATIVKITPDWVFLDLGGKSEGILDKRELLDAEGSIRYLWDYLTRWILFGRDALCTLAFCSYSVKKESNFELYLAQRSLRILFA